MEALDGLSLKGKRLKEIRLDRGVEGGVWRVVPDPVIGKKQKKLSLGSVDDVRQMRKALLKNYHLVPLKKVPVRVAKYDVRLRQGALRAVQAMHAILSHMVLFDCKVCKERFPAFHPAYRPPSRLFNEMEVLKRGGGYVQRGSFQLGRCARTSGGACRWMLRRNVLAVPD